MPTVAGSSNSPGEPGVRGDSSEFDGVLGFSTAAAHAGVAGVNENGGNGVMGRGTGNGVFGICVSPTGVGVVGTNDADDGVRGFSKSGDHSGVVGTNTGGVGVFGQSDANDGVRGLANHRDHSGVVGTNTGSGAGVLGQSKDGAAVHGISAAGTGLVASGGQRAAFFDGAVEVKGRLTINGRPVEPEEAAAMAHRIAAAEQQIARIPVLEQQVARIPALEQQLAAVQAQLNTVGSNVNGRLTQAEIAISALKAFSHSHT
ncbi:MAG: hypothetical protein QOH76_4109 [Thermoleophilaceae bacterium]|nr:hypothetical protein [Thermoleophilaceae bacterium]